MLRTQAANKGHPLGVDVTRKATTDGDDHAYVVFPCYRKETLLPTAKTFENPRVHQRWEITDLRSRTKMLFPRTKTFEFKREHSGFEPTDITARAKTFLPNVHGQANTVANGVKPSNGDDQGNEVATSANTTNGNEVAKGVNPTNGDDQGNEFATRTNATKSDGEARLVDTSLEPTIVKGKVNMVAAGANVANVKGQTNMVAAVANVANVNGQDKIVVGIQINTDGQSNEVETRARPTNVDPQAKIHATLQHVGSAKCSFCLKDSSYARFCPRNHRLCRDCCTIMIKASRTSGRMSCLVCSKQSRGENLQQNDETKENEIVEEQKESGEERYRRPKEEGNQEGDESRVEQQKEINQEGEESREEEQQEEGNQEEDESKEKQQESGTEIRNKRPREEENQEAEESEQMNAEERQMENVQAEELGPKAKRSNVATLCSKHNEKGAFWCESCIDVVCLMCITTAHKGHPFEEITKADAHIESALKKDLARTMMIHQECSSQITESISEVQDAIKNLQNFQEKIQLEKTEFEGILNRLSNTKKRRTSWQDFTARLQNKLERKETVIPQEIMLAYISDLKKISYPGNKPKTSSVLVGIANCFKVRTLIIYRHCDICIIHFVNFNCDIKTLYLQAESQLLNMTLGEIQTTINREVQHSFFVERSCLPDGDVKRRMMELVKTNTWNITGVIDSIAASRAIERKQPDHLTIFFNADEAGQGLCTAALSRIFRKAQKTINVSIKCLDSFYGIEGKNRDTDILQICNASQM